MYLSNPNRNGGIRTRSLYQTNLQVFKCSLHIELHSVLCTAFLPTNPNLLNEERAMHTKNDTRGGDCYECNTHARCFPKHLTPIVCEKMFYLSISRTVLFEKFFQRDLNPHKTVFETGVYSRFHHRNLI